MSFLNVFGMSPAPGKARGMCFSESNSEATVEESCAGCQAAYCWIKTAPVPKPHVVPSCSKERQNLGPEVVSF